MRRSRQHRAINMNKKLTPPTKKSKHVDAIKELQSETGEHAHQSHAHDQNGLADLQQSTVSLMNQNNNWGFTNSPFKVKRQKLTDDLWKITVENPKTREIILEAEGNGNKVFAYEDSLARMAELLSEKDIKITTRNNH